MAEVDLITSCRRIARDHQYEELAGVTVDAFTANAVIKVYDALNATNKARFKTLPIEKAVSVVWDLVK